MTDRVPGAPGRYSGSLPDGELQKLQRGESFAITLTRDDAPIVEGTPYSKAAVLPDELAAKLCPGVADPAPKDALAALYKITAQGVSGNWAYRKWENGVAECWCSGVTLAYEGSRILSRWITMPFSMRDVVVSMTIVDAESAYLRQGQSVLSYLRSTAESGTMKFSLIRSAGGLTAEDSLQVSIHITGTWK